MKIRNGFVSNSSSTCFIVSMNKPKVCPTCGHKNDLIIDLVSNSGDYRASVIASDTKGVLKEIDDRCEIELVKIKKLIKSDKAHEFAMLQISRDDGRLNDIMNSEEGFKVVYTEEW